MNWAEDLGIDYSSPTEGQVESPEIFQPPQGWRDTVLHAVQQRSHGSVDQRCPVNFPKEKALVPVLRHREMGPRNETVESNLEIGNSTETPSVS